MGADAPKKRPPGRPGKARRQPKKQWRGKANVIAGGLFTLLKGELSKTEKAALGMDCLEKAGLSVEDKAKIATLLFRVGGALSVAEG